MGTFSANASNVKNEWYLVDATNQTLGRLAANIAHRLRGKHKATFTPHVDTGDFIVVINAQQLKVTGNKLNDKMYYKSTSRPGSLKEICLKDFMAKDAVGVLEKAVKGMLPKGPLGRKMFKKLKAYAGAEHPHAAQCPKKID